MQASRLMIHLAEKLSFQVIVPKTLASSLINLWILTDIHIWVSKISLLVCYKWEREKKNLITYLYWLNAMAASLVQDKIQDSSDDFPGFAQLSTWYITHCRTHTVRAEIFTVVLFSRILRVKPLRKFPLQFMSIYSNDNISKIVKLTPRELPHLAKTAKITVHKK